MDEKKKVSKYLTLYMTMGVGVGMMFGASFCAFAFDKMALGVSTGMSIGMCLGIAFGAAKDKRLSENMMEISQIKDVPDSTDKFVYAVNQKGEEKEYRIDEKRFVSEKFSVGDRVAEEKAGYLVSLESK